MALMFGGENLATRWRGRLDAGPPITSSMFRRTSSENSPSPAPNGFMLTFLIASSFVRKPRERKATVHHSGVRSRLLSGTVTFGSGLPSSLKNGVGR